MNRIVALHGNLGMPDDWLELEQLSGLSFDKRCLWEPDALEFEAGDVLLGYSLGGRLALQAAVAEPEKFSKVIVLSAHPGLATEAERKARRLQDAVWAERALTAPWAEFLQRWDAQDVLGASSKDRSGLERYRQEISRSFTQWSLGCQADLRAGLKHLCCPLVWISGADDAKFTELAANAGSGIHEVIAGGGHRVHFEQPVKVAQVLIQQLSAPFG
jgi:2-succinyl-6-hydroxy-2,4-cyclohexadiene-1-carboxylate synthase